MAKPSNRKIWEMGIPIRDAWLEFASLADQERFSKLAFPEKLKQRASNTDLETMSDLLKLASAGIRDWTVQGQFKNELQAALLNELFNDQLAAYGFRVAPSRSREPVRMAAELFDEANTNWRTGEIAARGCSYSEIRVIDLGTLENWGQSRPGPKGSGDTIRAAIASLQGRQINLCSIPRKEAFELIRTEIGGQHPKGSGLSDVNLAKYLLEFCPKRQIEFD